MGTRFSHKVFSGNDLGKQELARHPTLAGATPRLPYSAPRQALAPAESCDASHGAALSQPRPSRTPVLFVHGWNSSANVWTTMIGRFKKDGWLSSELTAFSYNTAQSNATTADISAQKVDSIRGDRNPGGLQILIQRMRTGRCSEGNKNCNCGDREFHLAVYLRP